MKANVVLKRAVALALSAVLAFQGSNAVNTYAAKKVKVTKITVTNSNVEKKTLTITKGKKVNLKVKVTPVKATNKKVTYKSSNKKIVTVTNKGVVKGIKAGTAKVTITAKDGSKKKYVLKVKVNNATTPITTASPNAIQTPIPNYAVINGKKIIIKTVSSINNTDFTVTVKSELEDGTKLSDIVSSSVKTALANTSLTFCNEKSNIVFSAEYKDYSNDNDVITYKISSQGQLALQPSKNNGEIGKADGQYLVSSTSIRVPKDCYTSYSEALVGNSLTGYIYAQDSKVPMKNVNVTAYTSDTSKTVATNEDGFYSIPLTSANYKVKAEAADSTNYFSANETGKISMNNKTGCNMFLETYNREELFINGIVKSKDSKEPLDNAVVCLYKVNADKTETLMGTVTTDASGIYMFQNSQASESDTYKKVLEANGITENQLSSISNTFTYKEGLDRGEKYKIVIKKELSKTNITDVYKTETLENIKFDTSRQCNMNTTTLTLIPATKNIAFNVQWLCALPSLSDNKATVNVKFCYKNSEGYYVPLISKDVTLNVNSTTKAAEEYDLAEKNYFDEKLYPTLPTGKYYILVKDENKEVSAIAIQEVNLVAGSACVINTINITDAKSTSITTKCSVLNQASVKNFVNGGTVNVVSDTEGTLLGTQEAIKPIYMFYQSVGNDLVYISKASAELKYENSGTVKIEAETGMTRTAEGATYTLIPTQSYIHGEKSLTFKQTNQAISGTTYSCNGAANIDFVKIKEYSLIKTENGSSLTENSTVRVDNIKLLDGNNQLLAVYDCEGKKYTLSELKNTGIQIPETETGFKGLTPSDLLKKAGEYKVVLDLVDYEPVTESVLVTDFQSVTVTETGNINYTQKTTLYGSMSITNSMESGDVQDTDPITTDAVLILYDKDDKVVGVTTYGNKQVGAKLVRTYTFVNGENAYLEGGEYTLVARGTHHNDTYSFETYIGKVTIGSGKKNECNLDLDSGSNGSVTLSITDENNNYLENGNVTLYDEKSLDLTTFQYVPGYSIYETLSKLDKNLLGIYDITLAANSSNEWIATECLPKGTYTSVITSDKTVTTELPKITLSSGQHYESTGIQVPLIAGKDEVKLTIKYANQLDLQEKSPFEMICIYNSKGVLVAQKAVFDTKANTTSGNLEYNIKDVYIPNVADTYTVVIFSNNSFLCHENITVQGTSKTVEVKLVKSSIN